MLDTIDRDTKLSGKAARIIEGQEASLQNEADRLALYASAAAGFSPQAFVELFDRSEGINGSSGNVLTDFFGETNSNLRRLREIKKALKQLPRSCREISLPPPPVPRMADGCCLICPGPGRCGDETDKYLPVATGNSGQACRNVRALAFLERRERLRMNQTPGRWRCAWFTRTNLRLRCALAMAIGIGCPHFFSPGAARRVCPEDAQNRERSGRLSERHSHHARWCTCWGEPR